MLVEPEISVTLPHGLWDEGGACHRRATLRALSGREELMLGSSPELDPAAASALLATCLRRVGGYDRVDASLAAALTRDDRSFLALRLRAQLYGDRLSIIARCPSPRCGQQADMDLRISELAPEPADDAAPPPDAVSVDTPSGRATVRHPTGEDDAAVHAAAAPARERAALLWARLAELDGQPLSAAAWSALPGPTRGAVALALAEARRLPDLSFVARCPACRAWLELTIDPFALLARELATRTDRLMAEVHCFAFHYGWSEAEALALPRPRRWRYLELMRRELDGRPLLDAQQRI
jgi:hypothetical protein